MGRDPRLIELVLRESTCIVRQTERVLITESHLGIVMANAGVDQSNVEPGTALLLPEDPDRSAKCIRDELHKVLGVEVGVIIADSIGRAWRRGITGHAIGVAGVSALVDLRRSIDLFGNELRVTETARADEIATAATLVMGQGAEGLPAVIVRGLGAPGPESDARSLLRPLHEDLFR
jgi:coenzyme F420-0:L-glutamate ligase/coenzyme F420-1:gamma-L-glutamate ligase